METILCKYLKYPFHWKQFFISWKYILSESFITVSGNGFSFQWRRYSFIHIFFGNHYCNQREAKVFKTSCICQKKLLSFFSGIDSNESSFRSSETAFFRKFFVLASGNGFLINYKLYAFIRTFSLLVETILEIRCKPFFFHFFYS